MNDHQLLPVESALLYTADFTDSLSGAVTVTAVVWGATPALTLASQVDDFANNKSTIKVSGAAHGLTYVLQAKGTLSSGEAVVKDITLQGFNA